MTWSPSSKLLSDQLDVNPTLSTLLNTGNSLHAILIHNQYIEVPSGYLKQHLIHHGYNKQYSVTMTSWSSLPYEIRAMVLQAAIDSVIRTVATESRPTSTAKTDKSGKESAHRRESHDRAKRAWERISRLLSGLPDMGSREAIRAIRGLLRSYEQELKYASQDFYEDGKGAIVTESRVFRQESCYKHVYLANALAMMASLHSSRAAKKLAV